MRIAYIVPGSGQSFYCENCFRDSSLISGLRATGHDVSVVPLYLPLNEEEGIEEVTAPLFFGAVRLYLEEHFPLIKRLPFKLRQMLNSPSLLRMAASRAGSTRSSGNEKLILTMLKGESGKQAREFRRVAAYVVNKVQPDAVIISNLFLLGVGTSIKIRENLPIYCFAQDEDKWIDDADFDYRDRIWKAIAYHDSTVSKFFSLSKWYINKIAPLSNIAPDRFEKVPFGVNPDNYSIAEHSEKHAPLGFLNRLNYANGLEMLIDAFCFLSEKCDADTLHLSLCGGTTADDRVELARLLKQIEGCGAVDIDTSFGIADRARFLSSLGVLSVPCPEGIAYGTFIIEALASGVPVVQPDIGGFSEIGALTDSVILYSPTTVKNCAEAILPFYNDSSLRKKLGTRGREFVMDQFMHTHMAEQIVTVMEKCCSAEAQVLMYNETAYMTSGIDRHYAL